MSVGAGGVALLLLPWRICAVWTIVAVANEVWGWYATRRQYLRLPISQLRRFAYLCNLSILILNWLALATLYWRTHSIEGGICAFIIWLSVVGFAQTFASRTPVGFTICGVFPSINMFAAVMLEPPFTGARWAPIVGMIVLALAFALAGARQTFAAGRRLNDAQAQLRDREAKYRVLADNVADVVGRATVNGEWRYISPSVLPASGYTPDEFQALAPLEYIHPEDRSAVQAQLRTMVEQNQPGAMDYRLVRKDGVEVWMETSFSFVSDPQTGRPCEMISMSRDITTRKEMEADLVRARESAEAAAEAEADFLANMTHELRTPLNAIIGFSTALKASAGLSDRDQRYVRLINDASSTLLVVVNSVLDFSKLESGAFAFEERPFNPAELARAVMALVEDQAGKRGLFLTFKADQSPQPLMGDGPRLQQVILNLLSNALKFTTTGGVEVAVAQTPQKSGQHLLQISVTDTGVGIPDDQLERIFERFSQADRSVSRRFGGTGLGLAICKRIIEGMGGRIGVTSRQGQGSTFWLELRLPAAPDAEAAEHETIDVQPERPLRLLLVEDVAVNREVVRTILADYDVEIDEAANGLEALQALECASYDLVLMDVQMPVMDGLTATGLIRESEQQTGRRTPVIAMTANVLPDQVRRCLNAGMDGHVGKPITPAELLRAIVAFTSGTDAIEAQQQTGT